MEEETKKRQVEMTTVLRRLESEYEDRLANLEETRFGEYSGPLEGGRAKMHKLRSELKKEV